MTIKSAPWRTSGEVTITYNVPPVVGEGGRAWGGVGATLRKKRKIGAAENYEWRNHRVAESTHRWDYRNRGLGWAEPTAKANAPICRPRGQV
jgi:hypothetical protein